MAKLNTTESITCPLIYEVGNFHFEGRCEDCDVLYASRMNLGTVEDRYRDGRIGQDLFEAYHYVWALKSPTGSHPEWSATPTIPAVRRIARKLLIIRDFDVPPELEGTGS